MTCGIGWLDDKNAYLVADSIITYRDGTAPRSSESIFGEPQREGEVRVEESAVKAIAVTEQVAAVFAGQQTPAVNFLSFVRKELLKGSSLRDILETVRGTDPFEFKVVFGCVTEDGPRLFFFESKPGRWEEKYEPHVATLIGSLPADGGALVTNVCAGPYGMAGFAENGDRVLAAVLATMQAVAQRSGMIRDRAGGTFFGLRVDAQGVHRQPDIWYVLYRDADMRADPSTTVSVYTGMRENIAFAWTGGENKCSVFVTDVREVSDGEIEAFGECEFSEPPKPRADFFVFIERTKGALILIEVREKAPKRYLVIDETADPPTIGVTEELARDFDRIRDCDPGNVLLLMKLE